MLPILFAAQAAGIGLNYYSMKQQERYDRQAKMQANLGFDINAKAYDINDLGYELSNRGFELTNDLYNVERQGSELDMQTVRLQMQQETLAATQASIADTERLGEVMSTQRAILAARGTSAGTGSAGTHAQKTLSAYGQDEKARNMTMNFRKLQGENQLSLMKIHQFGQGIEQAGNRLNQMGNQLGRINNQLGKQANEVQRRSNNISFQSGKSGRRVKFLTDTINMFSTNSMQDVFKGKGK